MAQRLEQAGSARQVEFARVAPMARAALLIGPCGGFLFATILTISAALHRNAGAWWEAMVQAHGHLQLYGWAALFALGVAMHFLPRLRGAPLAFPFLMPWILGLQVTSIVLRGVSQPLAAGTASGWWLFCLAASGILEVAAIGLVLTCVITTFLRGQPLAKRPALLKVLPLLMIAGVSLGLAAATNLINTFSTAHGIIPDAGDTLNVSLGLFGFLVPLALAMSAQALPMYAGLTAFTRPLLWTLAATYLVGFALMLASIASGAASAFWASMLDGVGMCFVGVTLLVFVVSFIRMIRSRGRIPTHMARLASSPQRMLRTYQEQIATQRRDFGPFVALIASAYLWASLAAVLLLMNGIADLWTGSPLVAMDAIRHSLTAGFITLLLSGIAPRMITAFSGGAIVSPRLITATLWLGNGAALSRVFSVLLLPLLGANSLAQRILFGVSGPLGLAVAICLAVNLWPALHSPLQREAGNEGAS